MRLHLLASVSLSLFAAPLALSAAPAPTDSLAQVLERTCADGSCTEGYRVRFRQISFETSKQQATALITLLPNPGIDYPILNDNFEAQLVQTTFAGICKIHRVASLEKIREEESDRIDGEFLSSLKACISSLAERTEKALGRPS